MYAYTYYAHAHTQFPSTFPKLYRVYQFSVINNHKMCLIKVTLFHCFQTDTETQAN